MPLRNSPQAHARNINPYRPKKSLQFCPAQPLRRASYCAYSSEQQLIKASALGSSVHTASAVQRTRCGAVSVCSCSPRAEHSLFCSSPSAWVTALATRTRAPPLCCVCSTDMCAHALCCRFLCVLQCACTNGRREQEEARCCCWPAVALRCVREPHSPLLHATPLHCHIPAPPPPLQARHEQPCCVCCAP